MAVDRNQPCEITCPIIDDIIEDIKDLEKAIVEDVQYRLRDLDEVYKQIEVVRNANHDLRTWGTSLAQELNNMEFDYDGLILENNDLKQDISDLEIENKELKQTIIELENKIKQCQEK